MNFREWLNWFKSLHRTQRWFIIFILIRPLVDNFYYLKNISALASPLYIVGILTPILALWSISSVKPSVQSSLDGFAKAWLLFILFSSLFVFISDPWDLDFYDYLLKTILPFVIYFFARRLVISTKNMDGILMTFLYSSVIVAGFLLYEIFVHPFKSITTRGVERLEGNYADVLNYAIYIVLSFLIGCYFFLRKNISVSKGARLRNLVVITIVCLVAIVQINHAASFAVFGCLIVLFFTFYLRHSTIPAVITVVIIGAFIYTSDTKGFQEDVMPLIQADIDVYHGEREQRQLFHGRFGRWENMWENFSAQPITSQFFGVPLSIEKPYQYILKGTHNDYLRIIFLTGFIGFTIYLLFLFNIFRQLKNFTHAHKFLLLGALAIVMLYSVSTAPNLYSPLVYIVYSIFALAALPRHVINDAE